jgi:hypothetical protein
MAQDGIIGGVQVALSKAMMGSAFTTIAIYNVLELGVIIGGLYFYSMLILSWGIMIYALASIMKFYQVWMKRLHLRDLHNHRLVRHGHRPISRAILSTPSSRSRPA